MVPVIYTQAEKWAWTICDFNDVKKIHYVKKKSSSGF